LSSSSIPSLKPALSISHRTGYTTCNSHGVRLVRSQTEQIDFARQGTQGGIKVGRDRPFHIPDEPEIISYPSSVGSLTFCNSDLP
jgi:hypothetical protein